MAGYSHTPLARKLGIAEGHRVLLMGVNDGIAEALQPLPPGVLVLRRATRPVNVIVACFDRRPLLLRRLPKLMQLMRADTGLWLGWPKKASGRPTDLDFDAVQGAGLAAGLVDNKICALDDTWSGLRLVVRRADRPDWPRPAGG